MKQAILCPDCKHEVERYEARCNFCGLDLVKFGNVKPEIVVEAEFTESDIPKAKPEMPLADEQKPPISEHKENSNGPGKDKAKIEETVAITKPTTETMRIAKEDVKKFQSLSMEPIPGDGFLFNIKEEHLPEASCLNERQVATFSIGDCQNASLDPDRTQSIFEIYRNRIMRYNISLNRDGRGEYVTIKQLTAEEKNMQRGGLLG
jgi:hypothetical protein